MGVVIVLKWGGYCPQNIANFRLPQNGVDIVPKWGGYCHNGHSKIFRTFDARYGTIIDLYGTIIFDFVYLM